jgi:hypothetical protein
MGDFAAAKVLDFNKLNKLQGVDIASSANVPGPSYNASLFGQSNSFSLERTGVLDMPALSDLM